MTIDRLNPIDPIQNPKKNGAASRAEHAERGDAINLSSEAVEKAELFGALEVAKSAPDVRADRVAELKAKIDDPSYINDAVLAVTADKILDQLL